MKKIVLMMCFVAGLISCATNQQRTNSDEAMIQNLKGGAFNFHFIDSEATRNFINYYRENPNTTFNEQGGLINPYILPADVSLKDYLDVNVQRRNESNPEFGIIRSATGPAEDPFADRETSDWKLTVNLFDGPTGETTTWVIDPNNPDNYTEPDTSIAVNPQFIAVKREIGLDGRNVKDVQVVKNESNPNRPFVAISFDPEGVEIIYWLTAANVERPLAIVFNDTLVISIMYIEHAIKDNAYIECASIQEANDLARILKNAAQFEQN